MLEIDPGAWVYGRQGTFVGTVEAAGPTLLRVRGRGLFPRLYYVPRDAVLAMMTGGHAIFLSCRADEIDRQHWGVLPDGSLEQGAPRRDGF